MADTAAPAPPPAPAADPPALDALPLSAYMASRKGAPAGPIAQGDGDGGPQPPPPPATLLEAQAQGEEAPAEPDANAPAAETARERAAKASRTRGVMQARIDELTREKGEAVDLYRGVTARLQALEQRLSATPGTNGNGHAPAAPSAEPGAPGGPGLPDLDKYVAAGLTYEQHADAKMRYLIAESEAQRTQRDRQEAAQRTLQEQIGGFPARAAAVRAAHPDFDQVVADNDQVQLSPVMSHVTLTSARGAEVAYWLGTHPEEANEIATLTSQYPPQSYQLVERHLVALLGNGGSPPTGSFPAAVPQSRAPAPISPVGGGVTAASAPLEELPLGDYMRRRQAHLEQLRKAGRR